MRKEKFTHTLNPHEDLPPLPGLGNEFTNSSDLPPMPQFDMPGSFEFGSGFETREEKIAHELGELALASTVTLETNTSLEVESGESKLNEFAIENLESMDFNAEQEQRAMDLLNSNNPETLPARRVIESVLADDLLVEHIKGRSRHAFSDSSEIDFDLMTDTKTKLLNVIEYAEDANYRHSIDNFNEFFESTNLVYMEARDSGYPEDLLVRDRLAIFSRYSGNSVPLGKTVVEHSIDKSLRNFNTAADLGEGANTLREVDPGVAKSILQNEAYRRESLENYDKLDSDKCLEIAKAIEKIKTHEDEDVVKSGLSALERNIGEGYENNIHMAQFMDELISSEKLDIVKSHENLEIFSRDEVARFNEGESSESFIKGMEDLIDWSSEAGYTDSTDIEFIDSIACGLSRSRSPETFVENFKNLEFVDRLRNNPEDGNLDEYRRDIVLYLFSGSSDWLANNPELTNAAYAMYDSQESKQKKDFRLLLSAKERLEREFMPLSEEYKDQIDSHFNETYSKYINRTDKDGNRFDSVWSIYHAIDDSYKHRDEKGLNPEALEWFDSSSDLPMFAYPSVASMRNEAVANGVEDNPKAVYDFIYNDPEMVSKLSSINRDKYIKSRLVNDYEYIEQFVPGMQAGGRISDEEKFDQLQNRALREAYNRQESFRTFININQDTLKMVAEKDMQLKSILDAGVEVNHGDAYNARRSGVEVALGIRSMNSDESHPIYGSAGFVDRGYPDGAWGYGEVMLVFNDEEMNSRSTFTAADSFHGADRMTREDAMIVRAAKDINGIKHTRTSDYVEVQVRGSVDISKAEKICVEDFNAAENLRQFLPEEMHSKIVVRSVNKNNP